MRNDRIFRLQPMKRYLLYLTFFLSTLLLTGCHSLDSRIARFQKQLSQREQLALRYTGDVVHALASESMDSVRRATASTDGILFYIFSQDGMVYWSDNWLAGQGVMYPKYDRWFFYHFENAECVCRWTLAGTYNVLTIIPVKYAYSFENQQLRNTYVPPFDLPQNVLIRQTKPKGSIPVSDLDGNYLFSLLETVPEQADKEVEQTRLAESFSYQKILTTGGKHPHGRIHFYISACVAFLIVLLVFGILGLIRSGGIRDMRLSLKFQYLIVLMLLVAFVYVFVVSARYMRRRYEERQRTELRQKAKYVQKSLQDLYYWNMHLSQRNTQGMNVDLRDLCFSYETDINVYDMEGNLVGSSSPAIFEKGIKSTHIHPEPFFSKNSTLVRSERIGDMDYMAAYTEFFNGNYVQIGYIEVPYYVAADERHLAVDDFLSRIFPSFLLMMILSVIFALVLSRGLTRPLQTVSTALRDVQVGKHNRHLEYTRRDEVGAIVEQYNRMVDQLDESTEKLARSEREDAWRTMARQIAHEINNMLTPMQLNIQNLQRLKNNNPERFNERFDGISETLLGNIESLSNIATSFSSFAKMPDQHPQDVDVAVPLNSVYLLFRDNKERISLRYIGPDHGVHALADAEQIRQVFVNLIKNAMQALEGRKDADIIIRINDLPDAVEISVNDNGPGIPEEVQARIFQPYFTTKSTGTGLGLGISKNIVEGCGGTIRFETSPKGTTFFVRLRKKAE